MVNCGGVRAVARARTAVFVVFLLLGGGFLLRKDFASQRATIKPHRAANALTAPFDRLPLAFEPNQGQADSRVKFLAHGQGYEVLLAPTEAALAFSQRTGDTMFLEMRLAGAQANADLTSLSQLPGSSNYFIGNNPSRWRTNIPQFARVRYRSVYPGVDLDFYGKQGRLEYDFDVNPGADSRQIELDFSGAQDLKISPEGDLLISLQGSELRFHAPRIYQQSGGQTQSVAGNFELRGNDRVGFGIGNYDRSRTLVIDPVLSFSTYLGGTGAETCEPTATTVTGASFLFVPQCPSVAVDAGTNVYIAGTTTDTTTFPVAPPPSGGNFTPGDKSDVFVSELNSSGTALVFTTFIGGSGLEYPVGIAVDSGFNVYVAGTTNSPDFPTTATAFQPSATGTHVFFSKIGQQGSANEYSTYLAGSGIDVASSLAVDSQGLAYIFGTTSLATTNPHFPTTPTALQGTALAPNQFFFSKLNPAQNVSAPNTLEYSTFIGGSTPATGTVTGGGIAVDSANPPNVYLAGGTTFIDMPLLDASQTIFPAKTTQGTNSVWAARLNAPANNTQNYTPNFETYFGGSGDDLAFGVATDGTHTFVTGSTTSPNITIPTGVAPLQSCLNQVPSPNTTCSSANTANSDAFVADFGLPSTVTTGTNQNTVPVDYFTYLGGAGDDVGTAIIPDIGATTTSGNVRVAGFTADTATWSEPIQNKLGTGGGTDAFIARVLTTTTTTTTTTTDNTSTVTFVGGSGTDMATSLAEDSGLNTYLVGETSSTDFPTAAQPGSTALQTQPSGPSDAFVSKLGPNVNGLLGFTCIGSVPVSGPGCPSPTPSNPTVNPSPVGVGQQIKFVYNIYNQGDPVSGAIFTSTVQGTNSIIASASISGATGTTTGGGSCPLGTNATSVVCNLGLINTSNTTTTTSGSTTTTTTAVAATVTVTVNATAPPATNIIPPKPQDVGNIGTLTLAGTGFLAKSLPGSAQVNDFGIEPAPGSPISQTVTAGDVATYSLQIVPTGPIPNAVTLSATGQPTQSTTSFSPSSIPSLNGAPQSVTLKIGTTVRVTTPARLFRSGGWTYALWLPLSGLAFIGGGISRKRKLMLAVLVAAVLATLTFQPACGYNNGNNISSTTGTPAGTYNITVNAVSGATRSTVLQLVVQ